MDPSLTLVTGATGLVGNNMVRLLLERGQAVRVLVRAGCDRRPLDGLDVETIEGDVRDADAVRRAARGAGWVVHSAGIVQLGRTGLDLQRAVNVEGTRHVAQSARAEGARMVHVSSCDTVKVDSHDKPADEQAPFSAGIAVPYVITKCEAERFIGQQAAQGLDAVIVNPSLMLGPWDWKPSSGRMLLEVACNRGLLAPRGTCSLCDVRDVAGGILAAIERGVAGERYLLAGVTFTYLEAWRLFAEVCGARRPLGRAGPLMLKTAGLTGDLWARLTGHEPVVNSGAIALAALPKSYTSARAEKELGYTIRPIKETIGDAWEWLKEHGYA